MIRQNAPCQAQIIPLKSAGGVSGIFLPRLQIIRILRIQGRDLFNGLTGAVHLAPVQVKLDLCLNLFDDSVRGHSGQVGCEKGNGHVLLQPTVIDRCKDVRIPVICPAGDLFAHAFRNRIPFILLRIVRDQICVLGIICKYPLDGFIHVGSRDPGIGPPDHAFDRGRVCKDLPDKGLGRFIDNAAAHNVGPLHDLRFVEFAVLHRCVYIQQDLLVGPCDHQRHERPSLEFILQIDNGDRRIGRQPEPLVNDVLHPLRGSHRAYVFRVRFPVDQIQRLVITEHHIRMVLIVVGCHKH